MFYTVLLPVQIEKIKNDSIIPPPSRDDFCSLLLCDSSSKYQFHHMSMTSFVIYFV